MFGEALEDTQELWLVLGSHESHMDSGAVGCGLQRQF